MLILCFVFCSDWFQYLHFYNCKSHQMRNNFQTLQLNNFISLFYCADAEQSCRLELLSVKLRGSLKMPRKQSSKQCGGLDLTRGITKTNFSHCFVSSVISWRVPALLCLWRLSAWRCCSSTSGDKPRMTTMTLTGGWSDSCTYSTVVGKHRAVHINLLQESLVLNLRSYVFVD